MTLRPAPAPLPPARGRGPGSLVRGDGMRLAQASRRRSLLHATLAGAAAFTLAGPARAQLPGAATLLVPGPEDGVLARWAMRLAAVLTRGATAAVTLEPQ